MTKTQKNISIVLGILLLYGFAYVFAFSKTLNLASQIDGFRAQKSNIQKTSQELQRLDQKYQFLDSLLIENNRSLTKPFEQVLLSQLTAFSKTHQLEIIAFGKPHIYENDQVRTLSYTIQLRGHYKDLIAAQLYLEQQRFGELIHIRYEKKKNYTTGRVYVESTLILQKISR